MAATTTHPAAQASQTRNTAIKKAYCERDNGTPSGALLRRPSGDTLFDTQLKPKFRRISELFENYFIGREIDLADLDGSTTTKVINNGLANLVG